MNTLIKWLALASAGIGAARLLKSYLANRRMSTAEVSTVSQYSLRGPHGEEVFTGPSGGKYYLRNDRKVYLRNGP